ncbi:MAG: hypothetical protein HXY20_08705 [Acidobacteria bacterium]|nr:hypothetical protein [Acidobacteriota bacterium]
MDNAKRMTLAFDRLGETPLEWRDRHMSGLSTLRNRLEPGNAGHAETAGGRTGIPLVASASTDSLWFKAR